MSSTPTFGPQSTADDVVAGIDLSGKTAVVTGASSGIGTETARALASAGARVILAVRDVDAGRSIAETIRAEHPASALDVVALDLTDLAGVRRAAAEINAKVDRIDLLINNAGVMGTAFSRTADGFEMQFGTNHLGHFLFTNLLRERLDAAGGARVVNLSSGGHGLSDILWDDPNYGEREYDKWESYGQSKTANILFSVELDQRLAASSGGHSFAVHPGMIATNLSRHLEPGDFKALMQRGARTADPDAPKPPALAYKSIPEGAATSVWAATSADLAGHGGTYLADCQIATPSPYALDPAAAARLWALSEELVGQRFP